VSFWERTLKCLRSVTIDNWCLSSASQRSYQ
jgi:hypothetical protein